VVKGRAAVANEAGIHVRPSGVIYAAARGYDGTIEVSSGETKADLASVMQLIALGLSCGSEVEISVSGSGEAEKLQELIGLFGRVYDFPPREYQT